MILRRFFILNSLLEQNISNWVESLYCEQVFHKFTTIKYEKLKNMMYASITQDTSSKQSKHKSKQQDAGDQKNMSDALKRELDDVR